jgi:hypothetical protein
MTHTVLLVAAALVIPVAWGYVAHWVMERFWPRRNGLVGERHDATDAANAEFLDFQI